MSTRMLAPPLEWFSEWQRQSGEAMPDLDAMPSEPALPDLLRHADGKAVMEPLGWAPRRDELRGLVQHWLTGTWPEMPPALTAVRCLDQGREDGAVWRHLRLEWAGPRAFAFDLELWIPDGRGPFPVFMTQSNHRRWAILALSRGYIACVYPGADSNDQSGQLAEVYPGCDWSKLTRRAWLAGRALDYVLTLPVADPDRVAITGHSRNGKQSLIAAAMDERFSAVISSSSGSGGAVSWRCSSEFCFQESVEFMTRNATTRDWFHPRLRFFAGREDRLPVDNHALLGLIAPRACLLSDAMTDGCGSMFGVEMSYLAAQPVYELLGARDALALRWRWGNHETDAEVIQGYLDWCDEAFGRARHDFPEKLFFGVKTLPAMGSETPAPHDPAAPAAARLDWLLGNAPPRGRDAGGGYGKLPDHSAAMVGLARPPAGVERIALNFGEYVRGELFVPAERHGPLTPVLWMHPFSHSYGPAGAYMVGPQIFHALALQGYAVLTWTQLGCGLRAEEGRDFYRRYPGWSKMGKMVRDAQAAIDLVTQGRLAPAAVTGREAFDFPDLDGSRLTLLGYSLGGLAALLTAAVEPRVAAVASFCGAVPFRQHRLDPARGAMQRFWQLTDLLPRLGLFAGRESEGPVGLEDLLEAIAPRPCLLVAPRHDREIEADAVAAAAAGAPPGLTLLTPDDYNRFQSDQHRVVLDWLGKAHAAGPATTP